MTRKTLIRKIRDHVALYRDDLTGIAWVENGEAGCGHSCHPNISKTGSVAGMRRRFWGEDARVVLSHGFYYNVDQLVVSDELDQIAADACECPGCRDRKRKDA